MSRALEHLSVVKWPVSRKTSLVSSLPSSPAWLISSSLGAPLFFRRKWRPWLEAAAPTRLRLSEDRDRERLALLYTGDWLWVSRGSRQGFHSHLSGRCT